MDRNRGGTIVVILQLFVPIYLIFVSVSFCRSAVRVDDPAQNQVRYRMSRG